MVDKKATPEPDTVTRTEYYEGRGMAVPNGAGSNGSTGVELDRNGTEVPVQQCQHCGKPMTGRPNKRWCSPRCREAHRRGQPVKPTPRSRPSPPSSAVPLDTFAELVGVIVERWPVDTLTIETAGLSVRIGRVQAR
jgi:hypothetical protein